MSGSFPCSPVAQQTAGQAVAVLSSTMVAADHCSAPGYVGTLFRHYVRRVPPPVVSLPDSPYSQTSWPTMP